MKVLEKNKLDKKYFEDGQLWVEIPFSDGLIHGDMKEYYNNGKLHNIIPFELGRPHGIARKYSENGHLIHQICWFSGDVMETYLVGNGDVEEEEIEIVYN